MLTTKSREPFELNVDASSSTVIVGPGTAQFGYDVARFDGTRIPYNYMTSLYGFPGNYQLSVLSASYYFGAVDMTCYDSTMAPSLGTLAYPSPAMKDATSRAIGTFIFKNIDGTVSVHSYSKVI